MVVWFISLTDALTADEARIQNYTWNIYDIKCRTLFADNDFSNFSRFIFKVNYVFMEEKDKLVEKML